MGPLTNLLLIIVMVILGLIGIQAYRMPIIAKMGLRNVVRRRTNAMIVVLGLMIGTAIISGSLVVGDTLENMFTKSVYDSYDETDETVYAVNLNGTYEFIPYSEYLALADLIANDPYLSSKVEGLSPEIYTRVSVFDVDSQLSEPSVAITAFDHAQSPALGKLDPKHGPATTGAELAPNEVYVNEWLADEIDIKAGHRLVVFLGENESQVFTVKDVVENEGRANFGWSGPEGGGMNIIMTLDQAQTLLNQTGMVNFIKLTNFGDEREGMEDSEAVAEALTPYLLTRSIPLSVDTGKQDGVEMAETGSEGLQTLFMALGGFSIIAGVMLIINIFVMLAEERKSEMGIARAVGMKQKHLMYMFLFEGTAYSVIASLVGTVAGLGVAWVIIAAFGSIFGGFNSLQFFTFTAESLVMSFVGGMFITLGTIIFASKKASKLNIIRAIRNIPEPRYARHELTRLDRSVSTYKRMKVQISDQVQRQYELLMIAAGALLMLGAFVDLGLFYDKSWAAYVGLSILIFGIGLLLRRYLPDEQAFTAAGLVVLFIWCYPYDIFEQSLGIELEGIMDMQMWFFCGVFMVTSALMVIMYNSDRILVGLLWFFGRFESLAAIFKTAISYPMASRFRTGMTLAMFSLIIFTITSMGMMMGLISGNIDVITEENSGGYDMVAFGNPEVPIEDIEMRIAANANLSHSDYTKIVPLYTAYAFMQGVPYTSDEQALEKELDETATGPFPGFQENATQYDLIGCSERFFDNSDYQLDTWDEAEYPRYQDVWAAVEANASLAVADVTIQAMTQEHMGPEYEKAFEVNIGDHVVIRDPNNHSRTVKIIGFTKQMILTGIFVRSDVVTEPTGFDTRTSYITLMSFASGTSDDRQDRLAKDLEREFLPNGMMTFIIKHEIEDQLDMLTNFFYLLQAFLGLGLIVGIAGLGVITIRAVAERRQQIGMLRAIGFKERMIWKSFLIETSYIALLGIIIGVALGIILGVRFWLEPEAEFVGDFVIPWGMIIPVSAIAYLFTFICTVGPAKAASKVPPAEALRYVG